MSSLSFEKIHELGAKRHPESWFCANRAAADGLWDSGLNISDPDVKRAVSLVVLKVLDATGQPCAAEQGQATPKRSLSAVLEELCPGVRKRNWPAWAGPYTETDTAPLVTPMMTQDEDDAPTQPPAGDVQMVKLQKLRDENSRLYRINGEQAHKYWEITGHRQQFANDLLKILGRNPYNLATEEISIVEEVKKMAAALAVAREGMVPREQYQTVWDAAQKRIEDHKRQLANTVSLDDVQRVIARIRYELSDEQFNALTSEELFGDIRNRLAKPAEQTDEDKVADYLQRNLPSATKNCAQLAAEIVDMLKEGKSC